MLYSVSPGLVQCWRIVKPASDSVCEADLIVNKGRGGNLPGVAEDESKE